jgi:hypothetical protein
MPLNPVNYSNTIMYKIVCNDLNITDSYIGHTTDFKSRKYQHKNRCNNENNKKYNLKVYQYIRNNGGWDNWSMIMIEEYDCNSKLEATKRERKLIEELKATLNYNIPSRTRKEYYEDNIDKIREQKKKYNEYSKIYYENNKEKYNESINCVCGSCYTFQNKARHEQSKKHQNYLLSIASLLSV